MRWSKSMSLYACRRRLVWTLALLAAVPFVIYLFNGYPLVIFTDRWIIQTKEDNQNQSFTLLSKQVCVPPLLDINHPSVAKYFEIQSTPLVCDQEANWVYTDNGTFRISSESQKLHGEISCKYTPFRFRNDFSTVEDRSIESMRDGTPLQNDFFSVLCNSSDGKTYFNLHSGIAYNAEAHRRAKERPLPANAMGLSVLMLGLDSISRMTMKRKLPKTVSYFTSVLKGLELEGYNIVGDGTPAALLPILTGLTEEELPEARRGFSGAKTVDGHPWIMKKFQKIGYVTQWAEDGPDIGTFTFRMLGFSKPPVDHYMRPFYVKAFPRYWKFKPMCFGSTRRYYNHLKWFREACVMYGEKRKFMFSFHGEYSHHPGKVTNIQQAEEDTLEFLHFLQEGGHLNNTILILMSDHGARFSDLRKSVQGKLEERLPYFGFRFPPWFEQKYPMAMRNFRTNVKRLSVPFDIHATFLDILDYRNIQKGNIPERGISLFREIPKERSCAHAGVAPHWCACLSWVKIGEDDPVGLSAINRAIQVINSATEPHRSKCEILQLINVTEIVKYSINQDVLKFKGSIGHTGKADLSDQMTSTKVLYQVTFQTIPGFGIFESTVKHSPEKNTFTVDAKNSISRINEYGDAPSCVMHEYPHLRPYCYCKKIPGTGVEGFVTLSLTEVGQYIPPTDIYRQISP